MVNERCSANAPRRLTPTRVVPLHSGRRPARHVRLRPQTTGPSPLTTLPRCKSAALAPTGVCAPIHCGWIVSWPYVARGLTPFLCKAGRLAQHTNAVQYSGQGSDIRTLTPLNLEKDVEFYEVVLQPEAALLSSAHFE